MLAIEIALKPNLKRTLICGTFLFSQLDVLSHFLNLHRIFSHLLADTLYIKLCLLAVCVLALFFLVDCKFLERQNFVFFITAFFRIEYSAMSMIVDQHLLNVTIYFYNKMNSDSIF